MSIVHRRLHPRDCQGYAEYSKAYACGNPPTHKGFCEDHIPYLLRRERDYEATPIETRQAYLDALKEGKNIGDAREIAGITLDVAMEITNRAIDTIEYHSIDFVAKT